MFSKKNAEKSVKVFRTMSTAQRERALVVATELQEMLFPAEGAKQEPALGESKAYVFTGKLRNLVTGSSLDHTFQCRLAFLGNEGETAETIYEISLEWGNVIVSREFIAGDSLVRLTSVLRGMLRKEGYA